MKLHETLVDVLVTTYEINSGWTEERKLKEALRSLEFAVYTQQDGTQVLVSKKQLDEARIKIDRELEQQRGR